jgi:hypothetical protein
VPLSDDVDPTPREFSASSLAVELVGVSALESGANAGICARARSLNSKHWPQQSPIARQRIMIETTPIRLRRGRIGRFG